MKRRVLSREHSQDMSAVPAVARRPVSRTLATLRLSGARSPVVLAGVQGDDGEWRIVKMGELTVEEVRVLRQKLARELWGRRKTHASDSRNA